MSRAIESHDTLFYRLVEEQEMETITLFNINSEIASTINQWIVCRLITYDIEFTCMYVHIYLLERNKLF